MMESNDNEDDNSWDFRFPMSKYDKKKHDDFEYNIRSIIEDDEDWIKNKTGI